MAISDFLLKHGKKIVMGLGTVILGFLSFSLLNSEKDNEDDDYENDPHRKTTGHPVLPIDLFEKIYYRDGEGEANRILDKVQRGDLSVDEVRRQLNRPGIPPEKWRDFEDGWRPDDW